MLVSISALMAFESVDNTAYSFEVTIRIPAEYAGIWLGKPGICRLKKEFG